MTAFEEMGVLPEIAKAVDEMEWSLPTDVQQEAVPLILGGGDVLMAAETGSGKTGAFCLPVLQIVWEALKDQERGQGKKPATQLDSSKLILNVFDRGEALAVNPEGLVCQSRDHKVWNGCRSNKGVQNHGKYYYEAKVTDEGLCRVGWATQAATLDLGTDRQGFGFGGTGKKSFGKQFDTYGQPYGKNDVVGCFLNLDDFTIKFSLNGIDLGLAFEIPQNLRRSVFYVAVTLKNAEMEFNFGHRPFKHLPGEGYKGLSQAENLVASNSAAFRSTRPKTKTARALIIEPSRELAEQTWKCIVNFKKHLGEPKVYELLVVGGTAAREQIDALRDGVDIVVGTPGRLDDLVSTGQLDLSQIQFFILDEADGLLSQGHGDLVNRLHTQIPKVSPEGKRLQMIVCSATLHSFEVKKLAEKLMYFPTWVDLKGEDSVPETVHHVVCMVDPREDHSWKNKRERIATDQVHARDKIGAHNNNAEALSEAVKILKGDYVVRAILEQKMDQGIIFCRTKIDCDNMEEYLSRRNDPAFSCVCLHGDRKPQERKSNLEKFKRNQVKFLICTDVAARGLDIKGVPYVINVTLPDEKANYVHRIGRVGRAERMGLAISLVSAVPEKVWYHSNCASRGRNCFNTNLLEQKGCCMWYNEIGYLGEIEEHLNCTIQQVDAQLKVPADKFDGKVTYGQKKKGGGTGYQSHTAQMAPTVQELSDLEFKAQHTFIKRYFTNERSWLR